MLAMTRRLSTLATALALTTLTGCGGSDEPSAACAQLSQQMLTSISEGLIVTADVTRGYAVELPAGEQDFGIKYAAAVEVTDPSNGDETVILGLGSLDSGPIVDADAMSRVYFNWGAAATEDSPMGQYQKSVFLSDAADEASGCL